MQVDARVRPETRFGCALPVEKAHDVTGQQQLAVGKAYPVAFARVEAPLSHSRLRILERTATLSRQHQLVVPRLLRAPEDEPDSFRRFVLVADMSRRIAATFERFERGQLASSHAEKGAH
eukprot:5865717-Amphidinium_carterae.1